MNIREKKEYVAPQMTVEEFDCYTLLCGSPGDVEVDDDDDYENNDG